MKNNSIKNLFKNVFINFLIKIIVCIFIIIFGFIGISYFISKLDFQWLWDISPKTYYNFVNSFNHVFNSDKTYLYVIGTITIIIIIFIYKLIRKISSYMESVNNGIDMMFDKEKDYIKLPKELETIEQKMNYLKHESERNERIARENEQRKDDLIVYLAHDLKTPLTSIIGYLSLLDEVQDMPKKQREKYIGVTLEKSYKLEDLINELFDIARFNSEKIILEKEEVNLNLMLEQLVDDFYPTLKEKNRTVKINSTKKIVLNADSDKLARVFENLIKNAINYSTDELITIDIKKEEEFITIIVANKGKKIPKEKLDRIFEKFYRADTSRTTKTGGSGLGLAIAKQIIELHDGTIVATSDDEFTKFCVKLPIK